MNKSILAAIVATSVALPGYTFAQSTPRVDERQEKQDKRIERGLQKGQITKKEAERLEKGQERIENLEEKALQDGKVTKQEKRRIEKAQDTQSQRIRKERHDEQNKKPN
jgi:hypothetical protein